MSDLISRQDAINAINAICNEWCYHDYNKCEHEDRFCDGCDDVMILQKLPTADVVEVVKCKECENWDMHWVSSTFTENAHLCVVLNNVFDGEFYCACGHKRRSF